MPEDIVVFKNLLMIIEAFKEAGIDIDASYNNYFVITKERIPIVVQLDEHIRYIAYRVGIGTREGILHVEKLESVNRINTEKAFIRASLSKWENSEAIIIESFIWIEGGISKKNLLLTFDAFFAGVGAVFLLCQNIINWA
jgi:hypothetical protein